ncbi:muscle M-line assembly protein unc-89 [Trichomycterus rosablanca]|uniref:muscle M-line assembly protein unc-89 n=1 Tax=Trichomycterus rosablanca TaxID=2290929 RepID=UPI002F357D10
MGSCQCCQSSKLCDPVDEVQGLLNSSDSKTSAKTDVCVGPGICQALEAESEYKEPIEPENEGANVQPPSPKSAEFKSSYSVVIQSLHTDASRAEPASQSASPIFKVSEQLIEAAATAIERSEVKKDSTTEHTQTSITDTELDSVKAQVEVERAEVTKETEALISNALTKEEAAAELEPMAQGESEGVSGEVAKVDTEKKAAVVDLEKPAALKDIEKPAAVVEVEKPAAVVDVEKPAAVKDVKKPAAVVDVEKPVAVVDSKKPAAVVDSKKPAVVVDSEKPASVMVIERPAVLVDSKKQTDVVASEKPVNVVASEKPASVMGIEHPAALVDSKKQADVVAIQKPASVVDSGRQANVVEAVKQAAIVKSGKQANVVDIEKPAAVVDTEKLSAEVNVEVNNEKPANVVDTEKLSAEVNVEVDVEKPTVEVDIEVDCKEKPKAQEVLADTVQPDLNNLTTVRPEVISAVPAQNRSVAEDDTAEAQLFSSGSPEKVDDAVKSMPSNTVSVELATDLRDEIEAKHEKDISLNKAEMKKDCLPCETQEPSEQVPPRPLKINKPSAQSVENGHVDDIGHLKDDAKAPQETKKSQTGEEPQDVNNKGALLPEPTADFNSTAEEVQKPESISTVEDQKMTTELTEKVQEAAGTIMNGLSPSSPEEKPRPAETISAQEDDTRPESKATGPDEAPSMNDNLQKDSALAPQPAEMKHTTDTEGTEDASSHIAQKEEIIQSKIPKTKASFVALSEIQSLDSIEDLYRDDDEITKELLEEKLAKPVLEFTLHGVGANSLAPAIDILAYSEKEWKGNTAKSNLIRKGYSEMSCSFTGLRRVRGDNYCSLRATMYQVLANTTHPPPWLLEEDFTLLPEKLEAQDHLIGTWTFPPQCSSPTENKNEVQKLKSYLELLQRRWQEAAESESLEDKQRVCESIFEGGEEEYGLLEVLKLLMLAKAEELYAKMQGGHDVPVFCWLLFARDTSENPRMFFTNHLRQVGFSGGLEQVEMFLLGYALQHTIQTFRLYKFDTEEFVTHYPDDHKQDWPCVCIVTEDDRHYNVPVRKPAQYRE